MAYRRYRRNYRRKTRRGRGGFANTAWRLAKRAAKGVVKYYMNPEYKFLDVASTATIDNVGVIISAQSLVAQGDDSTQRNGNSIKVTQWLYRATADINGTNNVRVRVMAFTDSSSNGTIPPIADVLQTTLGTLYSAPMNRNNGTRFKVLWDKKFTLDNDSPKWSLEKFKKMQHHIHYLNGTSTSASLGQGPIYILAVSDQPTANAPVMSWTSRMRFLDN